MAVLDKDTIQEFSSRHKNVYKYEVLGGLHIYIAKMELAAAHQDNSFFNCIAYVGLSYEQALKLAHRHNQTSHFVHRESFN